MRILILGGTGFLGPHEIDQAKDSGWDITIFNRGRTKPGLHQDDIASVTKLVGDRDPEKDAGLSAIAEAVSEGRTWDAVIDNSGYYPRHARASAELLKDAAKQYVFISTVSVYAKNDAVGADESADVGTLDDPTVETFSGATYGPLKAYCEQAVQEVFGDRATVVRPGLIVGPGDYSNRFTYWPVRCHRGGEVLIPDSDDLVQFIDVRDLAGFILTLVEQGHGGVFNAVGPAGPLTFREMVDGCKAAVSTPIEFVAVSEAFLKEHEVGAFAGPQSLPLWVPAGPDTAGHGTRSNARALAHGMTIRPLAQTAADTVAWYGSTEWADQPFGRYAGLSPSREAELIKAWRSSGG